MTRTASAHLRPLTKAQRQQVAILRSKAYAQQRGLDLAVEPAPVWNARETKSVFVRKTGPRTSRTSLTQATQGDFALLMAHFSELAGDHAQADRWYKRDESGLTQGTEINDTPETRRREIYLLREECEKKHLPFPAYPLAIARNRRWITEPAPSLENLTAHQLFSLKVTVKAKAKTSAPQA
jgi:hypothetical protein